MKKWAPLQEGDLVDIVAPGFACSEEDLRGAIAFLESWNLRVRIPKDIFKKSHLFSSPEETRFSTLKAALYAKDSKAIWCLRGGYGSIHLTPQLAKLSAPKTTKLFIGLSDISTLHLFLNQNWQWPTIHGPLLDRLGKGQTVPRYARELRDLVFGKTDEIRFAKLKPMNEAARKTGNIRAQVSGGNLITLQSSIGTKVHWQTAGQILFFEELGERGYRIDRALEHFAQTGIFAKCKGVIFGDFNGGDEPAGGNKVQAVLKDFASAQKFPVLKGLQSGHAKIQRPLPFHTPSVLKLSSGGGELICSTGVSMTRAEASL